MENKFLKLGLAMVAGVCLFLNNEPGVNLSIFGFLLLVLTLLPINLQKLKQYKWEIIMCSMSLLSFAWYGDFISFAASWCVFFLLQLKLHYPKVSLFSGVVLVIGNCIATPVRFWFFKQWGAFNNLKESVKKSIYYGVIPLVFFVCFLLIYAISNEELAKFLEQIKIDENIFKSMGIIILVFLVLFNAWFLMIPPKFWQFNSLFGEILLDRKTPSDKANNTYFLGSGLISFVVLSVLILVIIVLQASAIYKFSSEAAVLSNRVHEGVAALIVSLLMAIGVVLIYFNTTIEPSPMKRKILFAAKIWLFLNGVLLLITGVQNVQYITQFGLTTQRIGVGVFLFLSCIGLILAYIKVNQEKSNGFVLNRMLRVGLWTLVLSSPINFGYIITQYNITNTKEVDVSYLKTLEFNDALLNSYLKENSDAKSYNEWRKIKIEQFKFRKNASFLSKKGYYEFVKF